MSAVSVAVTWIAMISASAPAPAGKAPAGMVNVVVVPDSAPDCQGLGDPATRLPSPSSTWTMT